MVNMIAQLAHLLMQDNAILFIGTNLRQANGRQPLIQQVADALAERIRYARADRSLPAVARDFEVLQGRNALLLTLQEELNKLDDTMTPLHRLIADTVLPTTKVITTRFDRGLERALDQFHKPYIQIVRDTDVPFFDESKVTLIKIQGDINQPDSLVLTEDDVDAFISKLPTVSDVIRVFFATKTLIFLGYDLNHPQFKHFFRQVTRNLSIFRRTAYAIVDQPLDNVELRYWQEQGIEIYQCEATQFLATLALTIKRSAQQPPMPAENPLEPLVTPPLPSRPYKGLDSFGSDDLAIFAGRGAESQRLANRILAHRLVVLDGESGTGKTSLLQAGVAPLLAKHRGLLAICTPTAHRPLADLLQAALLKAGAQVTLPAAHGDLTSTIRAWQQQLNGPLVLAIDQFEQFFLVYNNDERWQAMHTLANLVENRNLNLRLVLVIREDFLGRLQELEDGIPNVLDVRFHLERLGREAAQAAIVEPAAHYGVTWEPALVQRLLDDLYASANGGIVAPQLQLVCDRLYQTLVDDPQEVNSSATITLAKYEELGGASAILGNYLADTVAHFPDEQQPAVQMLLGALVSTHGVKQRLALDELVRTVTLPPETVAEILERLTDQRLLQRYVERTAADSLHVEYELLHDSLVSRILHWLGDDFWAVQRVREIIRHCLPEWQARTALLSPDDLRLVHEQLRLMPFTTEECAMLYAAAVVYDDNVSDWRATIDDDECVRVLLCLLEHTERRARRQAAAQLAGFNRDAVALALVQTALADIDADVRTAAAQALALIVQRNDAPGQQLVMRLVAAMTSDATRPNAVAALVILRDRAPVSHALLPAHLRTALLGQVWGLRWRRHWPFILSATMRGLQGGFWGMAFGLGVYLAYGSLHLGTDLRSVLGLLLAGGSVGGVIGGTAASISAFAGAALISLQDVDHRWRTWLVKTLVGSIVMSAALPILGRAMSDWSIGLILGIVLCGVATAPWPLARSLRLLAVAGSGAAVLLACGYVGLSAFSASNWPWLVWIGSASGVGFAFGLAPRSASVPSISSTTISAMEGSHESTQNL